MSRCGSFWFYPLLGATDLDVGTGGVDDAWWRRLRCPVSSYMRCPGLFFKVSLKALFQMRRLPSSLKQYDLRANLTLSRVQAALLVKKPVLQGYDQAVVPMVLYPI